MMSFLVWKILGVADSMLCPVHCKQGYKNPPGPLRRSCNLCGNCFMIPVHVLVGESQVFAMRFCPTRWAENEDVAERANNVWDQFVTIIEHFTKLPASKQPKNNTSYDSLKVNIKDKLMKVKFHVFKDIAHKMNKFLKVFQTDAPMVPFLDEVLDSLMRNIMQYFVKHSILDKADTSLRLHKVDIHDEENLMNANNVIFGTAAKGMLRVVEPKIGTNEKSNFQKEYKRFLVAICNKLQEESTWIPHHTICILLESHENG